MKSAKLLFAVAALFAATSFTPAGAQQTAKTGESEASLAPGTSINASLKSSIDSKKAKAGDPVTAEVTEPLKSSDGRTILPKGTKLVGQVTQASSRVKGDSQSMLAMKFEKAVTKKKEEVPLTDVVLQAVAAPPMSAPPAMSGPASGPGSGAPSGSSNPSMSGSTGGARTGSSTTGSNPSNPYPGTAGPMEGSGGETAGPLPPNSRGVYGIPGVSMARSNTNNGPSTVLISNDKNIHLDSGTRLLLTVAPAAGNSTPGR
jgi:Bacterial conjugation TrbI-like protein